MAKSFKEISRKAEELIEQGNEAQRNVQNCASSVASCRGQVAAARRQLAAASQTDSEGNPIGDVEGARLQLRMAENQLEASQRALSSANREAQRVREQKNSHVREIESHNRVERSNLEKLRRLRSSAFAGDSAALTEGMAERLNEAEDTRVELLRSMGIDASPDYVSVGTDGAIDSGWQGGGFASLDVSGEVQRHQGGGSDGNVSGSGVAAPVGGALQSQLGAINNTGLSDKGTSPINGQGEAIVNPTMTGNTGSINAEIERIMNDDSLSASEKKQALLGLEKSILQNARMQIVELNEQANKGFVKKLTLKLSNTERYKTDLAYIDTLLEVYREELRNLGICDGEAMERNIAIIRANYLTALSDDLQNNTNNLYVMSKPDINAVADKIRADYEKYPPKQLITDRHREKIRDGILTGTVTEKDIRAYGAQVREKYDLLIAERNREISHIENEMFKLSLEAKNATTIDQKEIMELRRKVLVQKRNDLYSKYDNKEMLKKVIAQYRDVGLQPGIDQQSYDTKRIGFGKAKVIKSIETVRNFIPTDWVKKSNNQTIIPQKVSRGFFTLSGNDVIIALSGDASYMESCAFHEMGHNFEHLYPEILKIEKQFYDRRTSGESLQWLGAPYDKSELTRFDNFINPYMGKDYGGSAYELLSMGLEGIYSKTYNISRDPEFEDLILGILVSI